MSPPMNDPLSVRSTSLGATFSDRNVSVNPHSASINNDTTSNRKREKADELTL